MVTIAAFIMAAAAGGVLRFAVTPGDGTRRWPLGTMALNILGSFLLGVVAQWSTPVATVAGTGLLGALTTFSSFIDQVVVRWRTARPDAAVVVVVSIAGGIAAAAAGLGIG